MNHKVSLELIYVAIEKAAYAVFGGVFLWWFPFLNQWWIYLIISPVPTIFYIWLYSEEPVGYTGEVKTNLVSGLIVGFSHFISTSAVWYIVTHYGDRWKTM